MECIPLLDEFPTVSETVKAIKRLSSGKAPGSYAIPAEIYKTVGPPIAEKLTELLQGSRIICNTCRNLQNRRSSNCRETDRVIAHDVEKRSHPSRTQGCNTIIHLFKRNGNPKVFDNHQGSSFMSSAEKILAKVLLNRLNEHLEQSGLLPECECDSEKTEEQKAWSS